MVEKNLAILILNQVDLGADVLKPYRKYYYPNDEGVVGVMQLNLKTFAKKTDLRDYMLYAHYIPDCKTISFAHFKACALIFLVDLFFETF